MAEIVNASRMEWTGGGKGQARGDGKAYSHKKYLFKGQDADADNYEFTLFRSISSTRFAPRHRHNFDQFRFAIKGPCNYSPDQDVEEGRLGYFPEGAYYGPQRICDGAEYLTLQFGGASGFGFLSYAAWTHAYEQLGKSGTFEKGIYSYLDASGRKHNKDAWQALWEHTNNRSLIFPKPRMLSPVVMDPEAYAWIAEANQPGVSVKHLGTFNERGTYSAIVRIDAGCCYRLEASPQTRLLYVLSGTGAVDLELLEHECAARILKNSSTGILRATTELKMLVFGLPRFD